MSMTLMPCNGPMARFTPGLLWVHVTAGPSRDQGRRAYGGMRLLTQPGLVVRDGALRLLTVRVLASCRLFGPHPEERLKAASRRMGRAKSAAIHPHSRGTNARVVRQPEPSKIRGRR